jgi:hypothetical protein
MHTSAVGAYAAEAELAQLVTQSGFGAFGGGGEEAHGRRTWHAANLGTNEES